MTYLKYLSASFLFNPMILIMSMMGSSESVIPLQKNAKNAAPPRPFRYIHPYFEPQHVGFMFWNAEYIFFSSKNIYLGGTSGSAAFITDSSAFSGLKGWEILLFFVVFVVEAKKKSVSNLFQLRKFLLRFKYLQTTFVRIFSHFELIVRSKIVFKRKDSKRKKIENFLMCLFFI